METSINIESKSIKNPKNSEELVELIIGSSASYANSNEYKKDCNGNYNDCFYLGIWVSSSFARHLQSLVEINENNAGSASELETEIKKDFKIIEVMSKTKYEYIKSTLEIGIFEQFDEIENTVLINAIVSKLEPNSLRAWKKYTSSKNEKSIPSPRVSEEFVRYIAKMSVGYVNSEEYQRDCDGNYRTRLDLSTVVSSSFGHYIVSLVQSVINNPNSILEIKPVLQRDFEIVETMSSSKEDCILDAIATGAFEEFNDAEEAVLNTIVDNLGPRSSELWHSHILPEFFEVRAKPGAGIKILDWDSKN